MYVLAFLGGIKTHTQREKIYMFFLALITEIPMTLLDFQRLLPKPIGNNAKKI